MGPNDVIILDSTLAQRKQVIHGTLSDSEYFEVFCVEQVLKNFDLSYEEILAGIIDGSDDGGLDGFYLFVDGDLLDEDADLSKYKKTPLVELYAIQPKQPATFTEKALDVAYTTFSHIFDFTSAPSKLEGLYSNSLIEKVEQFRNVYFALATKHPELHIHFVYSTKGDTTEIHPKVKQKGDLLSEHLQKLLPGSDASVSFWGARELLESAQKEKSYTLQLKFIENPISTGESGYVALANLRDYWLFVTDSGVLRKYIFESNVRDWAGDVEVNQEIRSTLDHQDSLNFWWLNNGITILCSRATIAGKTMSMDDVQVVNGLQTTVTIHEYLKENPETEDSRALLVRVVVTDDPEARDRIIKATNHQTAIPPASLKATDRIQRDMETYFKQHGWYYDRRKNYYKNSGMPADKIIGIPYLAQALMTVLLKEPDNARARPSTLIKNEEDYRRVFSETIGFDIYLFCVVLLKAVEDRLRVTSLETSTELKRNLRYHAALTYVVLAIGKLDYKPTDIKSIVNADISEHLLDDAIALTIESFEDFYEHYLWPVDRVTKSREFREYLIEGLDTHIKGSTALPSASGRPER